jgi:hypothetical protein
MSEQVGQDRGRSLQIEEWLVSKGISGCPLCKQDTWKYDEIRTVVVLAAGDVRDVGRESPERSSRVRRFNAGGEAASGLSTLRSQLRGLRQAADYARRYELKCGNCGNVVLLDVKTLREEAATTQPAKPE